MPTSYVDCDELREVPVLLRLFLLFTLLPFVELALLWAFKEATGWLETLALVLLTGFGGSWLARHQGVRCWVRIQEQLARNEMPGDALLDGFLIFVAGVLLITPGILTDAFGLFLLVPPGRRIVKHRLKERFRGQFQVHAPGGTPPRTGRDEIIDVKFTTSTDDDRA